MGTSCCTTVATSTVGTGGAGALAPFVHPWKKRMLARPMTTSGALRLAKASVEKVVASSIGTLLKQSCWYLRATLTRVLLRSGLEERAFSPALTGKMSRMTQPTHFCGIGSPLLLQNASRAASLDVVF